MENHDQNQNSWRPINTGIITGLVIVAVGVILLLDHTGVLDAEYILRYWPAVLVIFGLVKLSQPHTPGRVWGGLLVAAGALLLLDAAGVMHVRFWDLWPLGLIAVGLVMMWGAIESKRSG